jgi:hypothetical protein
MSENEPASDIEWTPEASKALVGAAQELVAAINAQVSFVAGPSARGDEDALEDASSRVESVAALFANAYFELTGSWHPFGFFDENEFDAEDARQDEPEASTAVSVLYRADFSISDEAAVLSAGRNSYQIATGEDTEQVARKIGLGAAIHQLIHADGVESLYDTAGLDPLATLTQIIEPDELIALDDEEPGAADPSPAFAVSGARLFGSEEHWVD